MAVTETQVGVGGPRVLTPEIAQRPAETRVPTPVSSFASLARRWVRLIAGLWLFAIGITLTVRADLGLSSWDVLHDAFSVHTPLTFGGAVIAVSVAVVLASFVIGVRPGPGTVANVLLVGAFTDALLTTQLLEALRSGNAIARVAALVTGVGVIAVATALYISANLGAGSRDSLMMGLAKRLRVSAGTSRALIEGGVVIGGAAMGGRVGVGTALFAIAIGPAIDISFRLFGMQPPRRHPRGRAIGSTARAVRQWLERGQLGAGSSRERSRYTGGRI
ncbi:MAG: membrane protein [Actinomycetota bacterium]|nr:membrane protein [Actinomycetota bacterium]